MKFTSAIFIITGLGVVSANPLLQKRASTSESASLGYATLSGGTTGGGSATPVTVTTLDELKNAVTGNAAKVVVISGSITGNEVVKVGSNTSVLGKSGASTSLVTVSLGHVIENTAALNGVGLRVIDVSNVIIRNLKINKVLAKAGDAIGVQAANRVWIDSLELWSDKDHNKDYYDGLLDITHGCYAVSVTNSYLHDHWKASLVGHSDNNEKEDLGIQVTYAYNKWQNLNSRTPSFRFGHGHIFNNYFLSNQDGINTRVGAELLVQNNVWEGCKNSVYSTDNGYANVSGNDYGGKDATALATTWNSVGYSYALKDASEVKAYVESVAGAKLSF
ncbi:putative pectate lyase A OS=Neosartorya fumigata (strain ATCC MYA-4609 / Af293 / CBS 101355 / FGSC A1100) GN=plyA PE=3 SV=1 [Rhizoctonia solani AG-1 IB]|uniref:Putative pectate lyase A n=1 Tax=Thanatephorus cucumeris (strain AG1-IB / isolate 7/3/14) TaxID=1108050 RepID=A0A0B7FTL7_THACB|nr:putative pectate lyase A OS=Neosartorya fumigata (strain ATCC MYA-4609 / Af293 / CBS 101355 / FGSC A1100) GN=plyA PE=3 SV=1 [Rhizoctonia solani AG-1 IB]